MNDDKQNGNAEAAASQPGLEDRIRGRIANLLLRKQALVSQIAPIDAAISELEALLSGAAQQDQYGIVPAAEKPQFAQFAPVPQGAARIPARTPVQVDRRGPMQEPLAANAPRPQQPQVDVVMSPKSGTPVPTNAALLKASLRQKGGI